MRTAPTRFLATLLAAAMLATACADDTSIDDILGSATSSTTSLAPDASPTTASTLPPAPPSDEIPAAPAPEPDPTPLPIDGDYRIGTLDNGLTYLLRSNDTPGESLDLRLLIDAGSLQQPVGLDGSAHFLEHMLFNGTTSFPGNELTAQLQRLGVRFGADVNAFTSYDATGYILGATTFDEEAVRVTFDVLREWASEATLDPADVAGEVGVIRDERRQGRETVDGEVFTQLEQIYTRGTPYEGHMTIGDADLIDAIDAPTLRAFYDTWYRPDNMAVVVVGDLPLDRLEEEVVSRFADLQSRATDPQESEPVAIALDPTPVIEVIAVPDAGSSSISIEYPLPVWDTGTVGGERMTLVEQAVAIMLNSRLADAFQRGDIDVDTAPTLSPYALNRGLRYYGSNVKGPDLPLALDQFLGQLLVVARDGFTDDDLDRVRSVLLAALEDERATLGSTQDAEYATELSSYWFEGASIDDDENRIARIEQVVRTLTVEELTDFWRWLLASSGPIVVPIGESADDLPTVEELSAILGSAQAATSGASGAAIDELMARPEPAEIVASDGRRAADGNVAEWTFDNGIVVAHQQTTISEGTFDIWFESDGGWTSAPDPDASLTSAAVDAVLASGVGPHDRATLTRYLESRDVAISALITEEEEGLYGNASTGDAEDLFALLHLMVTEPRVDDVALRSVVRNAETVLETLDNDADLRQSLALTRLLAGGDSRYDALLEPSEISALDADDLLARFTAHFGETSDLRLAIVGDIAADDARDLAARYLGTLPTGASLGEGLTLVPPTTALSESVPLVGGTANGGTIRFDWVDGAVGAQDEITGAMLGAIVSTRIIDTIREELGASYGGSASIFPSRTGDPALLSIITVDGDPSRLEEIKGALAGILAELATAGPTADEFDRAGQVLANDYNFVNDYLFLSTNMALLRFPEQDVLLPEERFSRLADVSPDDIRDLANRFYGDPASVQVDKAA